MKKGERCLVRVVELLESPMKFTRLVTLLVAGAIAAIPTVARTETPEETRADLTKQLGETRDFPAGKLRSGSEGRGKSEGHHHDRDGHSDDDGHHGSDGHGGGHGDKHHHGSLEVPANASVPRVNLIVRQDELAGWNLEIRVENFAFAPDRVNQESTYSEGHAHLYIDGEKITRLYGSWYYLPSLEPGRREIVVSLNANGHEALIHQGEPIEARQIVEVPSLP